MERSAGKWLEAVRDAERRGELLEAVDVAERALVEHPRDRALEYRLVLALARTGSTEQAQRRFDEYGLGAVDEEDFQALGARLAKDEALAATGRERLRLAGRSADLYESVLARTGGYYPAINAATMRLVADDERASHSLAQRALERTGSDDDYYAEATRAEAQLLLGAAQEACRTLERTAALHGGDHGALATTRRQLALVCELTDTDRGVLAPLAGPRVAHFCGHRIGTSRFPHEAAAALAALIGAELDRRPITYGYGALASGADILFAEALLDRGADVHVVLPFAREEFVAASVAPAGADWVARFQRCLEQATSVIYATEDAFLGDDILYRYGTELAMGLALLRARFLSSEAVQLAAWDGQDAQTGAGTAIDVARWRGGDRETVVLWPELEASPSEEMAQAPVASEGSGAPREVHAMLFGDIKGFSKLSDEQLPAFAEVVMGAIANVLGRHADAVELRNTWGDGLYLVLRDAAAAAACALDLQAANDALDLRAAGLPEAMGLRLGGHVGPVFPLRDPVLDAPAFMGSHVSRTARIEPVTPPGAVYVTEPFAAALALSGDEFACDYVGHMPAAKDYGRLRMHRLRRGGG